MYKGYVSLTGLKPTSLEVTGLELCELKFNNNKRTIGIRLTDLILM